MGAKQDLILFKENLSVDVLAQAGADPPRGDLF